MIKRYFGSVWGKLSLIVILGFVIRLLVYGFIKMPWIIFDEFIYLDTARQIIRGQFMSNLSRDPQLYPPGWPLVLASFTGFFKNPFFQYKAGLLLTMLISSLVPLAAYLLVGSFWVALIVAFYPPLFVYSSSIMSESLFILMILLSLGILKYIIKDDLRKNNTLVLASVVFAFFIFYTRLVRSFGMVLLPSFLLATLVTIFFLAKQKSFYKVKKLIYFSVLVSFFYLFFDYLAKLLILPDNGFYKKQDYVRALFKALSNPKLSLVILRNEISLSLYWLGFILPVYFFVQLKKELHKKEWHLLLPRFFAVFIYLSSLFLTFAHMFIGAQKNPQYLVFSRYIDPSLVVLFVYMLSDFLQFIKSRSLKIKVHPLVFVALFYFLFYFIFKLAKLDYKFGNTMPIYFFLLFKNSILQKAIISGLVLSMGYLLYKNSKQLLLLILALFFFYSGFMSIKNTISTPAWVQEKYSLTVKEWQMSLENYQTTDIPLCIHKDGISSEVYYLYHFLNPYQYLKPCSWYKQKPRRILTRKDSKYALPSNCNLDFRFSTLESIIYCPLGY